MTELWTPSMSPLPLSDRVRRLTQEEKEQYARWGYVKNLPVFADAAVPALQEQFHRLLDLFPEGIDINQVNCWHKANRWVYELCRTPAILDYVEDLAGPNFFQWGAHFFCKFPRDGSLVPWHQDAQYWPLEPRRTVTVWLAIFDADDHNGAMRVVRGSHRRGEVQHHEIEGKEYVLNQEADSSAMREEDIVTIDLKAGEISLHDDGLIHGSGANDSDRVRAGLTMRFCPTDVKCDLSVWPNFESHLARGVDEHCYNPVGKVPSRNGYPVRKFQSSAEFE